MGAASLGCGAGQKGEKKPQNQATGLCWDQTGTAREAPCEGTPWEGAGRMGLGEKRQKVGAGEGGEVELGAHRDAQQGQGGSFPQILFLLRAGCFKANGEVWLSEPKFPASPRGRSEILEAQHPEPQFPSPFLPPGYPHHLQPRHRAHRHALGVVPGGPAMASESFGCSFLAPPHHQQTPLQHHRTLSSAQMGSFALQGHPRKDPSSAPLGQDELRPTAPLRGGLGARTQGEHLALEPHPRAPPGRLAKDQLLFIAHEWIDIYRACL